MMTVLILFLCCAKELDKRMGVEHVYSPTLAYYGAYAHANSPLSNSLCTLLDNGLCSAIACTQEHKIVANGVHLHCILVICTL